MNFDDTNLDEIPNVMRYRAGGGRSRESAAPSMIAVIGIGLITTLALIAATLYQYSSYVGGPRRLPVLGTLAVGLWLASRMVGRRNRVSSWIRVCSLMLVLHLALLVAVHGLFVYLVAHNDFIREQLYEAQRFRAGSTVLAMAAALVLYQWWSWRDGRQRDFDVLRKLYIAVLGFVLVLGLWAPILVNAVDVFEHYFRWQGMMATFRSGIVWTLLAPPLLTAMFLCIPRVEKWLLSPRRGYYFYVFSGIALAFGLVRATYVQGQDGLKDDFVAYINCLPILLGAGAVCLMLIGSMAASHWRSLRGRARSEAEEARIEGVVVAEADGEEAGRVYYEGWLPGLRMQTSALVVRGPHGDLPIPAGTRLVASLPSWTIGARVGESKAVLADGDRVVVHGFEHRKDNGPFRASHLPLPGRRGIVVVKAEASVQFWREFSLLAWRPMIAYLGVGTIVAIPGLVGLLTHP